MNKWNLELTKKKPYIITQGISTLTKIYKYNKKIKTDGVYFDNSINCNIIFPIEKYSLVIYDDIRIFALNITEINYKNLIELTITHIIEINNIVIEFYHNTVILNIISEFINNKFNNHSIKYLHLSHFNNILIKYNYV